MSIKSLNIRNHANRRVAHLSTHPAWRDVAEGRGVVVSPQSPPQKLTYSPDLLDSPAMIQSIKIYSLENTKPHYRLNIFLLPAMHRQVLVNLYIHFIKYAINLSDFENNSICSF